MLPSFLEMEKLTFRAKFETLTQIVTPKLIFSLNLHQNIEQKSYWLTKSPSSNLILMRQNSTVPYIHSLYLTYFWGVTINQDTQARTFI